MVISWALALAAPATTAKIARQYDDLHFMLTLLFESTALRSLINVQAHTSKAILPPS
jgi:hypothetical protein